MPETSIAQATKTYETLSALKRERHAIHFPVLYRFSRSVRDFTRRVRGIDDQLVTSWVREIKRFRFLLTTIPLPPNTQAFCSVPSLEKLRDKVVPLSRSYPSLTDDALNVVALLEEVVTRSDSPILEVTSRLLQEYHHSALVLAVAEYLPHVENELRERRIPGVDVLTPNSLKRSGFYDQQLVIGTRYVFRDSEHVFATPRASLLRVIHVTWVNPDTAPSPVFLGSLLKPALGTEAAFTHNTERQDVDDEVEFIPDVFDYEPDAESLIEETEGAIDEVMARAFLLETDQFILFQIGSRTLIIDFASATGIPVHRIPVEDIEPGMFVLVRTDTQGDYIEEVANKLMGPTIKSEARKAQSEWKSRLRSHVLEKGADQVGRELRRHGCEVASPGNIRNWISPQSIATEKFSDFEAIMNYLGYGSNAPTYWMLMKQIRQAHLKAGQVIRRELLSLVMSAVDRERLEHLGHQDFVLHTAESVKLSAIRVSRVLDREYRVSPNRLGQLLSP